MKMKTGWDRKIFIGAFMVFSISFWFSEAVQSFLDLVISTGSDVAMRWQDQVWFWICRDLDACLFATQQ
jgi:hypothetical protein